MLLGEFLHAQIKKAGMNPDDEAVKGFLLNGEMMKIDVPEDIVKGIDSKLISLTDAKNNHPDIKPHYTQQALMTVDKTIEKLLDDLGFDDADKAEILSETSTYKRVPGLVKKVKDLEARKSVADKGDKAAIQKQIDDLHTAVRIEKEGKESLKNEYETSLRKFKIDNKTSGLYTGYKTIYDELDPEIRNMNIQNLLQKNLQDSNAEITFDENEKLVLRKKDGTNFYSESNQPVNPSQFLDMILSKNKILVTSQKPPAPPANNPLPGQQQPPGGGNGGANNNYLKSLIANSAKDVENSTKIPVM